jgi:hypothetical protein
VSRVGGAEGPCCSSPRTVGQRAVWAGALSWWSNQSHFSTIRGQEPHDTFVSSETCSMVFRRSSLTLQRRRTFNCYSLLGTEDI